VHPSDERYAPIVGKLCEIPVGPKAPRRLLPIITDDYPDKDFGSGAVKITGAHDFNDYQVAKRGGIPMYRLMDTRGHMRADGPDYAESAMEAQKISGGAPFTEMQVDGLNLVPDELRGLDRFEARKLVVEQINAEGLAVMTTETRKDDEGNEVDVTVPYVENKPIMQPFGDRSKVVIEPMLTDQWFVETSKIVEPALEAVRSGKTKIIPESGEKTYYHWLENIEPWCISRQLWWGHQIPVWYGPRLDAQGNLLPGQEIFCAASERAAARKADEHYEKVLGYRVDQIKKGNWSMSGYDLDIEDEKVPSGEATPPYYARPEAGSHERGKVAMIFLNRDPDVLDTWFSSGLWPIGTLGWPEQTDELEKYFPTDVLITGFDILFFWVARMMMMQLAVVDEIPFHTVYLHQLVRDEKGKKMSKTTGNVIDPLEIIDEYGADALRFTNASMAAIGGVLKLSEDRIKGYRNFGTKIWNATRFAEMNGVYENGAPSAEIPTATATVNKWIIGETARTREVVDEALAAYRFNDAASALYAFVWGKVCDWYVEFSKPLLLDGTDAEKAETSAVMGWVLDQCLILLHPIMPFITEELWSVTGERPKMLVHADWPEYTGADLIDAGADTEMNWVISLIEEVRSARAQMHVPAGLYVPMLVTGLDAAGKAAWANNEVLIKRLARIDSLTEAQDFPKGTATIPVDGGTFGMPLADIIDVDEEKARLTKGLTKLGKELGGLRGRLKNPKFVESAPEEVVVETRGNLALKEAEEEKLKLALARLEELG
jgi:valyl-tRNA synthetase